MGGSEWCVKNRSQGVVCCVGRTYVGRGLDGGGRLPLVDMSVGVFLNRESANLARWSMEA